MKYALIAFAATAATATTACTEPNDQLLLSAPDAPTALGSEFDVRLRRGTSNGPLCGRAQTANIHPLGPDLSDCRLGNDVLTILEARCDDDACTREDAETTTSTLRLRARKPGKATLRVRARGRSDGDELTAAVTFDVQAAARIVLDRASHLDVGDVTADLEGSLSNLVVAPGIELIRRVRLVSESGIDLAGAPEVTEAEGVVLTDSVLRITSSSAGPLRVALRAGDARVDETISVVDVAPAAPVSLRRISAGKLELVDELGLRESETADLVATAGGPGGEIVLLPDVAFEVEPPSVLQVLPSSNAADVSIFARSPGTADVFARGHRVAHVTVTAR